jgi:hypothetical protein
MSHVLSSIDKLTPGSMPASKIPNMNRTAEMEWMLCTNAVPIDAMPKHSEMMGMNQPGPIHLQAMLDGIW